MDVDIDMSSFSLADRPVPTLAPHIITFTPTPPTYAPPAITLQLSTSTLQIPLASKFHLSPPPVIFTPTPQFRLPTPADELQTPALPPPASTLRLGPPPAIFTPNGFTFSQPPTPYPQPPPPPTPRLSPTVLPNANTSSRPRASQLRRPSKRHNTLESSSRSRRRAALTDIEDMPMSMEPASTSKPSNAPLSNAETRKRGVEDLALIFRWPEKSNKCVVLKRFQLHIKNLQRKFRCIQTIMSALDTKQRTIKLTFNNEDAMMMGYDYHQRSGFRARLGMEIIHAPRRLEIRLREDWMGREAVVKEQREQAEKWKKEELDVFADLAANMGSFSVGE